MRLRMKVNNALCATLAIVYSISNLFFTAQPCWSSDPFKFDRQFRSSVSIMYGILGITFLIAGIQMNFALKRHFQNFYMSHSCTLWTATILLTAPLFFRSSVDLLENVSESFYAWYNTEAGFIFNITGYVALSTYIPIITQMGSLVFGFLRRR